MTEERLRTQPIFQGREQTISKALLMKKMIDVPMDLVESKNTATFDTENIIGSGDLSVVFRGKFGEEDAAFKVFLPATSLLNDAGKDKLQSEFEKEGTLLSRLDHKNIAKVYGTGKIAIGSKTELPVLVREYFPQTASERLLGLNRDLRIPEVVKMVDQVSSALDYMQGEGLTAVSDISPTNIMVRENGDYVFTDLNLAQAQEIGGLRVENEYSAPELTKIDKSVPTQRSQVYSMGLLAYEMLGGELPSREEISLGKINLKTPDGVSEETMGVLQKAVENNPEYRYKTPTAYAKALRGAITESALV